MEKIKLLFLSLLHGFKHESKYNYTKVSSSDLGNIMNQHQILENSNWEKCSDVKITSRCYSCWYRIRKDGEMPEFRKRQIKMMEDVKFIRERLATL